MKVCKHLKLNKNSASTLPGFRPLGTLALFLFVSSFPVQAVGLQETTTPRTFADWCLNKNNLSVETLHTINALLQVAKTTDCNQASKLLSALSELSLSSNQIADLKPLSTLTNLTGLSLDGNQIADLKPLSALTNLTNLDLDSNQIADLKPLSTLTNLTGLSLNKNRIADLKPLSGLTNLNVLYLDDNQITDLKPLSGLTNLIGIALNKNRIADLKPLSGLTNLTELWLNDNQIADLKPLSGLTNLTRLLLANNQTLTDKTCPVKPASICRFYRPPSHRRRRAIPLNPRQSLRNAITSITLG
jgi:internalin A